MGCSRQGNYQRARPVNSRKDLVAGSSEQCRGLNCPLLSHPSQNAHPQNQTRLSSPESRASHGSRGTKRLRSSRESPGNCKCSRQCHKPAIRCWVPPGSSSLPRKVTSLRDSRTNQVWPKEPNVSQMDMNDYSSRTSMSSRKLPNSSRSSSKTGQGAFVIRLGTTRTEIPFPGGQCRQASPDHRPQEPP